MSVLTRTIPLSRLRFALVLILSGWLWWSCGCAAPWAPAVPVAGGPPPPEVNAIILRGFFDFGSSWGVDALRNELYMSGSALSFNHFQQAEAARAAEEMARRHPRRPLVLLGHSFGGDSTIEVAQRLAKDGVGVDLVVQIDSVGYGDDELPDNVERGLNLYQRWNPIIFGEAYVMGASNHYIRADPVTGVRSGHHGILRNPITRKYIDHELQAVAARKAAPARQDALGEGVRALIPGSHGRARSR